MGGSESALGTDSFRATYDIVGSLPLELVLVIAKDLDPVDIVRGQRVSKRWRSIFSSDKIIMSVLRQTLVFLDVEITDIPGAEAMTYFRWRHGLQRARPVKKIFLQWPETPKMPTEIAYCGRRLCYRMPKWGGDVVGLLDLESGEKLTWTEDEAVRYQLWNFLLSDRYVIYHANDRDLVAWDTHKSQRYARKLPSSVHFTTIAKDKVAIVDFESKPLFTVYIWDLGSNLFAKVNSFTDLCLWHVDADESILVAFEIDWDACPPEVRQTKWTLTGGLLEEKHFRLLLSDRRADRRVLMPSKSCVELQYEGNRTYGHKTVRSLPYSEPRDAFCIIRLVYDHSISNLSAEWLDYATPVHDFPSTPVTAVLTPQSLYAWENGPRIFEIYNADSRIMYRRRYQLDAREVGVRKKLIPRPSSQSEETSDDEFDDDDPLLLAVFGDRELFGVASEDGIQFWIFNPNFTPNLPDAVPFLPMQESG